eukprot:2157287-Pleurochrysis_carterae.AAC.1
MQVYAGNGNCTPLKGMDIKNLSQKARPSAHFFNGKMLQHNPLPNNLRASQTQNRCRPTTPPQPSSCSGAQLPVEHHISALQFPLGSAKVRGGALERPAS